MQGRDTWFLTGTDEHGQKIERSAAAAGIAPQQFADEVSASFQSLWKRMGISYDQYIRTTDPAHQRGVQQLFTTLYQRGQIYLDQYTGQYCVSEEMFVEGPPGTIGPDGRPTETVTEENFYFRLSAYQKPLIDLIESNQLAIEPESRKNEVLSFLRGNTTTGAETLRSDTGVPYLPGALKDLSVSRTSFDWGIPVPEPAARHHHPEARHLRLAGRARQLHDRRRIRRPGPRRDFRKILARRPAPRRQGDRPLSLRLLARVPACRRPAAAQKNRRAWLAVV